METVKKKKYVVPEMEMLEFENELQLLESSVEPNTISDLDDYTGGSDPYQY